MQLHERYRRDANSITHSPYYGCTVRVVSKAQVSYEGVLDGISMDKDRIFLKNIRVKANATNRTNSTADLDTSNAAMIDHLTNDMHIYDQVCLNVRDIQELSLIRLPATFHESQAKLRAIDPCLLDIRLSPADEHERRYSESFQEYRQPIPIARRVRGESIGSNGGGALISSSSNESTSSVSYRPSDSQDEAFDEQTEKFSRLSMTTASTTQRPGTLLAKKVLTKKIERNSFRPLPSPTRPATFGSTPSNQSTILRVIPLENHRIASPIRVTITSKLNPDATPFYGQQQRRPVDSNQTSSLKFYDRHRFPPRLQPLLTIGRPQQSGSPPARQPHHRFIPPRQMALKKNFNNQTPPSSNKRSQTQQPTGHIAPGHEQIPRLMHPPSSIMDQIMTTPPRRERLSVPSYSRLHRSPVNLHPASSLPYPNRVSADLNQLQVPSSRGDLLGSRRGQRTVSGTSSGSSISAEFGPHSIVQLDSTLDVLTSSDGQYDFEKANEEFRRYLELEELVTRRTSSACSTRSHAEDASTQEQPQRHSYKKEVSFFDRISCTATTGTAVAYTEMDEVEKNRETFGDDALCMISNSNDDEW